MINSGKFHCRHKGKCGLNSHAACDACHPFLHIALQHPLSALDCLAFVTSSVCKQLSESEPLLGGCCMCGDITHINETFMATPHPNVGSRPKDDHNHHHSQVQINVECSECAFGALTNLCQILKQMLREDPKSGLGKPEPLKHNLSGFLSRRLSQKDRIIYKFARDYIYIFAIGGHYDQFV